jgi:hypothetical protein
MNKFSRSLALTKQSWSILQAHPQLSLFPIVSTVATLIVLASFAVPGYFMFISGHVQTGPNGHVQMGPLNYAYSFCFYLVSYFVVIFFNSALVASANEIFAGRKATFADGMRMAISRIGSIFVYALISATVGMILRVISERTGVIGAIASRFLGMAWTIATYFVAPILVVERKNPVEAIKESAAMLKKTWGEGLIVNVSLHILFLLIGLIACIPFVGGFVMVIAGHMLVGLALIIGAVAFVVILSLISTTLAGVFQTALYLYARTGEVPAGYDPAWIQQAFTEKPRKQFMGRSF